MKYIKTYESVNKKFWKVKTTEPEFTISLQKLGLNDKEIETFHNNINLPNIEKYDYVYVMYHISPGKIFGNWVYSTQFIKEDDKTFMGGIELNPEDFEKWNFKNDIKKYNL